MQKHKKQDCQALLKAKYCPRVMHVQHFLNPGEQVQAVSCTQKHTKNLCELGRGPLYSTRFLALSKYTFVQNCIKLSAAVHELSL